jgi:xanthine dehydrogenase large subunit
MSSSALNSKEPVGQNVQHDSSFGHVTGNSIFIDDRPEVLGEIHVGIVGSKIACGELISIDASDALKHPDCLGVFTAADFHAKKWGTIIHDQPFLVEKIISYAHEPICLVASRSRYSITEIVKRVKTVEAAKPGFFSITEAKQANAILYRAQKPFARGDVDSILKTAPHVLQGTFRCGGQEHFYLESQAAIAYPLENGQIEVHSSSQHPSETQRVVAEALGLSFHQVVCVVKRMGGGFGGKESQGAPIAAYAALVAHRFKKAARIVLTKDQDMMITGKRHPFENDYQVAFDQNGKILALKATLQSDGGAYLDLSSSILERAMFHLDGAYYLENVWIDAVCYRTHYHPHTAFRGFGGPQGNMTIESIIEDIAHALNLDAAHVRKNNLYQNDRVTTPYGQKLENNMLPSIFDQLMKTSDYEKRRTEIADFNAKKSGKIKGISITATKFGIAFTARFLNQGNALVNLHLDGTLQVSTGATEMGQGVNTKIQQIVAASFGLSSDRVQIMPTSTEKNHNTSPTAASSGADINGAAALKACNYIKARMIALAQQVWAGQKSTALQELQIDSKKLEADCDAAFDHIIFEHGNVKDLNSGQSIALKELITIAYQNRISLGDYAHFKTEGLGFDKATVQGKAFNYYTQGMAVSEVLIDEYTGEVKVQRVDILMDLGRMINPGIDRGQVIGGFVQAMGWVTTENLFYNSDHHLVSHSPTTYKIPNIQDAPRVLNVDFIENDQNDCNVLKSKAVGEPPFLLGSSVWTAIKHGISSRCPSDVQIILNSPATAEAVLMEIERVKKASKKP